MEMPIEDIPWNSGGYGQKMEQPMTFLLELVTFLLELFSFFISHKYFSGKTFLQNLRGRSLTQTCSEMSFAFVKETLPITIRIWLISIRTWLIIISLLVQDIG